MFARDARNWSPSPAGNPILHFTRGHYASLFVRVQEDAGAGEGGELRRDGAGPPAQDALGSLRVSGLLEMGKGGWVALRTRANYWARNYYFPWVA